MKKARIKNEKAKSKSTQSSNSLKKGIKTHTKHRK